MDELKELCELNLLGNLGKLIESGELYKKNKFDLLAEWDEFGKLD